MARVFLSLSSAVVLGVLLVAPVRADTRGQLKAAEGKVRTLIARIADLEQGMRLASAQLTATQGQLNQRAWVAYEQGPGSSLEFLLGSTSLADLTDRLEIMNHVAQTDADLISQINDQRNLLQQRQ